MGLGSLQEIYLDELGELYDAEAQTMRALPLLRDAVRWPALRETLTRQCEESRLHLERIDLIFTHWAARRLSRLSKGFAAIVQEADDRLHDAATGEPRDAAVLRAASRMQYVQIAGYTCAHAWASRLNRHDDKRLLHDTLEHKWRTAARLERLSASGEEIAASRFAMVGSQNREA